MNRPCALLALLLTLPSIAQETSISSFEARRRELRQRYVDARSPAEKRAILEAFRALDLMGPAEAPAPEPAGDAVADGLVRGRDARSGPADGDLGLGVDASVRPSAEDVERTRQIEALIDVYDEYVEGWRTQPHRLGEARARKPSLPSRDEAEAILTWLHGLDGARGLTGPDRARLDEVSNLDVALISLVLSQERDRRRREADLERWLDAHPEVDLRPAIGRLRRAERLLGDALEDLAHHEHYAGGHRRDLARSEAIWRDVDDFILGWSIADGLGTGGSRGATSIVSLVETTRDLYLNVEVDDRGSQAVELAERIVEMRLQNKETFECLAGDGEHLDDDRPFDRRECLRIAAMDRAELERLFGRLLTARRDAQLEVQAAAEDFDRTLERRRALVAGDPPAGGWPEALSDPETRRRWAGN